LKKKAKKLRYRKSIRWTEICRALSLLGLKKPTGFDDKAEAFRVRALIEDHFWRRRSFPEQRCRPDVPRVAPARPNC
jgi:hypothetical protein